MVLDGKSSQEYPVDTVVPQDSIVGLTLYLLYINEVSDDGTCNIDIYADDTTKVAALIRSTKFPFPEVALYLCKSTILPWNTVVICGLVFLAATWIC